VHVRQSAHRPNVHTPAVFSIPSVTPGPFRSPALPPLVGTHSLPRRAPLSGPPRGWTLCPRTRLLPSLPPPRPPCDPHRRRGRWRRLRRGRSVLLWSEPSSSSSGSEHSPSSSSRSEPSSFTSRSEWLEFRRALGSYSFLPLASSKVMGHGLFYTLFFFCCFSRVVMGALGCCNR
jgi:hypothetical protein